MKYSLILMSLVLLSACSLVKKKCTSISSESIKAEMVEANPVNSMYIFSFGEGPLAGCEMHINSQNGGEETDLFIFNPKDANLRGEPINKDTWKWSEKMNEANMTVSLNAAIQVRYEGKTYCLSIKYAGEAMKMMLPPPPPPQPIPVPED